ncbi:transposase [Pseudomonas aeruginosa]|nr:transposase [Pseudomonas aeruginosa]
MQIALSIQAGKISSPMLLRKLGSYSRRNKLYLAAQTLGSVIRTIFLLNWIGSRELRQEVTANTNKIESYNGFSKWLSFGGDVIAENDPDEQQKTSALQRHGGFVGDSAEHRGHDAHLAKN